MDEEEAEGMYQGPQLFRYDTVQKGDGSSVIYVPKSQV